MPTFKNRAGSCFNTKTMDVPFGVFTVSLESTAYLPNFVQTSLFNPDENICIVYINAFFKKYVTTCK